MTQRLKVLHLIDSGGLYGAEKMLLALCKEQARQGLQPVILSCGEPGQAEKPLEAAAKAQQTELKCWRMQPGFNRAGMLEIWDWIIAEEFAVLHSHGYKFNVLLALTRGRHPHIKIVSTVHGYVNSPFPTKGWIYETVDKIALGRLDAVVRVNKTAPIHPLLRKYYGSKLHVIYNGIELPEQVKERNYDQPIRKLLIVGRLSPEKGHAVLIDALAELVKRSADYTLTIAGDGPLRAELEQQVSDLALNKHVEFLGFVDNMRPLYEQADALVMPSTTEGLPITLLEALAFRLPVFATAVGGIPEVLTDERLILPSSENLNGLDAKLSIESAELLAIMSKHYQNFQELFVSDVMGKSYSRVYIRTTR